MKKSTALQVRISGCIGVCGRLKAFMGFAPANMLHKFAFADVLNEDTGEGYQRPMNRRHSVDFKNYILGEGASTIPLTFNLRKEMGDRWQIRPRRNGVADLILAGQQPCLAMVDCQHRLGELHDAEVPLAFMAFIGLDLRAEMSLFNIINSKAKGLSSSLTDYHQSNLLTNLAEEAPHLYIARRLQEDPRSPWRGMIRYGGETTSGLKRRTSLRMMQKAVSRFLRKATASLPSDIEQRYRVVRDFWAAVKQTFNTEWQDHRHNLLTKGVGLYALMTLLGDIVVSVSDPTMDAFTSVLLRLKENINWDSKGMFAKAGGQKGAHEVYTTMKEAAGI